MSFFWNTNCSSASSSIDTEEINLRSRSSPRHEENSSSSPTQNRSYYRSRRSLTRRPDSDKSVKRLDSVIMVDPIFEYQFRVILIGDSTVGKSSLLRRFTDETFAEVSDPTVGVDFFASIKNVQENRLFSGRIYTAGTNFTRPPVATVVTNLNSVKGRQNITLTGVLEMRK